MPKHLYHQNARLFGRGCATRSHRPGVLRESDVVFLRLVLPQILTEEAKILSEEFKTLTEESNFLSEESEFLSEKFEKLTEELTQLAGKPKISRRAPLYEIRSP